VRAVEWSQTARQDLLTILDYICDDNPDAAQGLKDKIQAKVALLSTYRTDADPGAYQAHES